MYIILRNSVWLSCWIKKAIIIITIIIISIKSCQNATYTQINNLKSVYKLRIINHKHALA